MSDDYTPTTEDILRYFCPPKYQVDAQRPDEEFSSWLARTSIETMHSDNQSAAAARRWLVEHDRQVAVKALQEVVLDICHDPRTDLTNQSHSLAVISAHLALLTAEEAATGPVLGGLPGLTDVEAEAFMAAIDKTPASPNEGKSDED